MKEKMFSKKEIQTLSKSISATVDEMISRNKKEEYKPKPANTKGKRRKIVLNRAINIMQEYRVGDQTGCYWPLFIDDVIVGVSRLDFGHSRQLSTGKIRFLLESFPILTADLIMYHLDIGDRFARDYLSACKIAIKYLVAGYKDIEIRGMRYPMIDSNGFGLEEYLSNVH